MIARSGPLYVLDHRRANSPRRASTMNHIRRCGFSDLKLAIFSLVKSLIEAPKESQDSGQRRKRPVSRFGYRAARATSEINEFFYESRKIRTTSTSRIPGMHRLSDSRSSFRCGRQAIRLFELARNRVEIYGELSSCFNQRISYTNSKRRLSSPSQRLSADRKCYCLRSHDVPNRPTHSSNCVAGVGPLGWMHVCGSGLRLYKECAGHLRSREITITKGVPCETNRPWFRWNLEQARRRCHSGV
jgi:hypothetical protein